MINAIENSVLQLISPQQAWHYRIIPFAQQKSHLSFYTDNGQETESLREELSFLFGTEVVLEQVDADLFRKAIATYYRSAQTRSGNFSLSENNGALLDELLSEASELGSSDIHFEPYEHRCRIRFRIDGVLIERYQIDTLEYPSLVNKIKIKGQLDIAEKRLPQDGRIFMSDAFGGLDVRVSTMPTLHGEKVVLRLLARQSGQISFNQIGFSGEQSRIFMDGINQPNGMVLVSGPTGSGKTSTLYAALQQLNQTSRNILTIEDPIEYTLEGINQVQLKDRIGLDYPSAMRTFLRQDPDVIMVGKVRDVETAQMAIRASLTGHLVLSTIHTNTAWGIVNRLIEMGVPGYLLADTLRLAVAQRLVRKLCPDCKTRNPDPAKEKQSPWIAVGCSECHFTGYRGRTAVFEVIPIDRELARKINRQDLDVENYLKQKQIPSLAEQAAKLVEAGITSFVEAKPILSVNW